MTLRTITYDTATHKLVPLEPTEIQIQQGCLSQAKPTFENYQDWWNSHSSGVSEKIRDLIAKDYRAMIEAAPEYQEQEQLCDDGGKCGAGGYCNNCAAPVVKENGKLRERLANQHAKIEQLGADNEVLRKQAERYEKVRKLDVWQFAEIFRMNIQEGIPFDELIDGICIFTAQDIAEAEKEGEKMWNALCGDSTQDIGKDE